ncbi:MAG: hypothetical protein ACRD4P_17070, partial [Bryobacteraceae bacterium]
MKAPVVTLLLALSAITMPCAAQSTVRRIDLGSAIDTTKPLVRDLARTAIAYFRLPSPGRTQTPLWVTVGRRAGALYDLTARDLYSGSARAIIVGIDAVSLDSTLFTIKTLFEYVDSASASVQPIAIQRLYARRNAAGAAGPHGWQLMGAIEE